MWMAENHHGSESKCISRRNDHAGNEWTASQSAAKKNRTHGQQQQQQQQQQQREQQPAPVIDLRVAHAMAMQSNAQPLRLRIMRWEPRPCAPVLPVLAIDSRQHAGRDKSACRCNKQ